jgi:hypothetical protein
MKSATILISASLLIGALVIGTAAFGGEAQEAEATATDEASIPEAKASAAKVAQAKAAEAEEIDLPPGFMKKKRGKHILYCKKDVPMGTRIKTETCLDEAGIRNYLLALQETKGDVDRIRAVCSNPCVCGNPGAC